MKHCSLWVSLLLHNYLFLASYSADHQGWYLHLWLTVSKCLPVAPTLPLYWRPLCPTASLIFLLGCLKGNLNLTYKTEFLVSFLTPPTGSASIKYTCWKSCSRHWPTRRHSSYREGWGSATFYLWQVWIQSKFMILLPMRKGKNRCQGYTASCYASHPLQSILHRATRVILKCKSDM